MKLLVCGGRDFDNYVHLARVLDALHGVKPVARVIHGGARGVDAMAGRWARARGIPCDVYPAEWDKFGKSAGMRRNADMLRNGQPDMVAAFPGGKGTRNMVELARKAGLAIMTVGGE
jgi:hypothetical protein